MMRLTQALPGILSGILTGVMTLSGVMPATSETADVIVRGHDLAAVAAAVTAHGGDVQFEIGLIDAVAADVPVHLVDDLAADPRTVEVTPDAQVELLSLPTEQALTTDGDVTTDANGRTSTSTLSVVTDAEVVTSKDIVSTEPIDTDGRTVLVEEPLKPVMTTVEQVRRGQLPGAAVDAIGGESMRRWGLDGSGIDVALIDSGIDAAAISGTKVDAAIDLSMSSSRLRDGYGHGTAMAGIIAGVAPGVRLVDVKVADERGVADVSQVLAGIDWVVGNRNTNGRNIRVLSLSFGTNGTNPASTSPLTYAVEAAWRHDVVVLASAGNHGSDLGRLVTPAISPWVIAVGAANTLSTTPSTIATSTVPTWSAAGDGRRNPDLVAPGRSLLGGLASGAAIPTDNPEAVVDGALLGSGSSQATAFASGVAAALLQARSSLTPDQVKAAMVGTATPLQADANQAGAGLLDLSRLFTRRGLWLARRAPAQTHAWSDGTGSLDGDRGSFVLENAKGERLTGERTVVGGFDRDAWLGSTWTGSTWTGSTWTGSTWTGSTWTGSTWTGSTWTGSTWTGSTWTGSTWTGSTWTGSTWTNVRWGE